MACGMGNLPNKGHHTHTTATSERLTYKLNKLDSETETQTIVTPILVEPPTGSVDKECAECSYQHTPYQQIAPGNQPILTGP